MDIVLNDNLKELEYFVLDGVMFNDDNVGIEREVVKAFWVALFHKVKRHLVVDVEIHNHLNYYWWSEFVNAASQFQRFPSVIDLKFFRFNVDALDALQTAFLRKNQSPTLRLGCRYNGASIMLNTPDWKYPVELNIIGIDDIQNTTTLIEKLDERSVLNIVIPFYDPINKRHLEFVKSTRTSGHTIQINILIDLKEDSGEITDYMKEALCNGIKELNFTLILQITENYPHTETLFHWKNKCPDVKIWVYRASEMRNTNNNPKRLWESQQYRLRPYRKNTRFL